MICSSVNLDFLIHPSPARAEFYANLEEVQGLRSERIEAIGGINWNGNRWRRSEEQAIGEILSGEYAFFVVVGGRETDLVITAHEMRPVAAPARPQNRSDS